MSLTAHIDVYSRIWTGRLVWTAICTASRCTLRSILRLEVHQRTLGSNLNARLVHNPTNDIKVVTALGKDNRRCLLTVAPLTTHIGVRHMCILYRLHMLNADQIANKSRVHSLTHSDKVRCIAKHMADSNNAVVPLSLRKDILTLLLCLGCRLLK